MPGRTRVPLATPQEATMARALGTTLFFSLLCALPASAAPLGAPSLGAGQDIRQETGEINVNGSTTVVRYTWRDSAGLPRSVSLVPASGATSGFALQMTYLADGGATLVSVNADPLSDGGFGYFVSHELFRSFSDNTYDTIASKFGGEDDSPLGRYLASTGTAQSVGTVQAVHEYRLSYPRWGTAAAVGDPDAQLPADPAAFQRYLLPVVIRWTFIANTDYPLWSVDYDLSAATDHIATDVRGPYGAMNFNNAAFPAVTALRWGDWYHFVADGALNDFAFLAETPGGLAWNWSASNSGRRYNVLSAGGFEFGLVDTKSARNGSLYADGYSPSRTLARPAGAAASCTDDGTLKSMPCPYEWAYQSFQYDFGPPTRPKLAWGSAPYLGTSLTTVYNSDTEFEPFSGVGHINYAVHIVMGRSSNPGAQLTLARAAIAIEPNPVLTMTSAPAGGGTIQYTQLGGTGSAVAPSQAFSPWTSVRLVAVPNGGFTFSSWSGACAGVSGNTCMIALDQSRTVTANFVSGVGGGALSLSVPSIDFGFQSMGTISGQRALTVTNTNGSAVAISGIAASGAGFSQTNDCPGSLGGGATCTIQVRFGPGGAAGPINSTVSGSGAITVSSNAAGSPQTVALAGVAEKSLVTHYYRTILHREPDGPGKAFWAGEATRVAGLGANVNEAWFAMAISFFASAEYASFNRDNNAFLGDLYLTFFDRTPDAAGSAYWASQLQAGLTREVLLASFLFSPEFGNFTASIFGNTAARSEVDVVMDFYRGLLARLPDNGGFTFWVQQFHAAQCSGNNAAANIYAQAESISAAFANSGEYAGRARSNAQFVGDLYNGFLRRGGDAAGVQFWINQLQLNGGTRDAVRQQFRNSPEFAARVNAIVAQGC
jgi:hypothetical protein